jgi:hypothetical protein
MLVNGNKRVALNLLLLGAFVIGARATGQEPARQAGKPDLHAIAAKPDEASPKPGSGRMFVVGRVVDPQGKPVPNASVMVYARLMTTRRPGSGDGTYPKELGRASSDGSGRFRADLPRTSSARHDEFGAVALAPGFGAGWIDALDPDADQPTADIALRPEQVIQGRLFDVQGEPARGVKLSVTAIRRVAPNLPNGPEENFQGPAFWWTHPDDLPGWPSPVFSGADGRFTVHGVGPGLRLFMSVIDPRFTSHVLDIDTDRAIAAKPLTFALHPVRTITGRVTYADTGKPVPHAQVIAAGFDQFQNGVGPRPVITVADAEGRFRVNTGTGASGNVNVLPPEGQPYLPDFKTVDWPKGAVAYTTDLSLQRGLILRGKVTEHGSGRHVAGAVVNFFGNRNADDDRSVRASGPGETGADGLFTLTVPARKGYLIARGPSDDYLLEGLDRGLLFFGQPGGARVYAHAFATFDPKSASASQEVSDVEIALRPGVTVKGRVVGPDGQPIAEAWIFSRINLSRRAPLFRPWFGDAHGTARNGQFELHGLDPNSEIPVSFFEPKRKLGATVRLSGKATSAEPIVVKLEPCATATARLVGPDGNPLGGFSHRAIFSMVVTPGEYSPVKARKEGTLLADEGFLADIDPINYRDNQTSDAQGRTVFPALIPGATYRIVDRMSRTPSGPQLRKEFTVKPGEKLDLGDILIERSKAQ